MNKQKIISGLADFFRFDFFLNEFKKYAHFGGRTTRKEYWLFILTTIMIYFGFSEMALSINQTKLLFLFEIIMFSPVVAATVRRLHDVGRSGHLIPLCLIFSVFLFFGLGISFQNKISQQQLLYLSYFSLAIAGYPFFLLFMKSDPNQNKYDTMLSHPYRHGFMAVLFILFLHAVIYLLYMSASNPQILSSANQPLTQEEQLKIDEVVQKYQQTH